MSKLKVSAIHDPDNDNEAITIDSSGNVTFSGTVTGAGLSAPVITSVTGTLFENTSSTLTLNGTNFIGAFVVTLTHNSVDYTVAEQIGDSATALTFTTPSALDSAISAGDSVYIKVTNASNDDSNTHTMSVTGLPSGGTITTFGDYRIHTFTSSGTFSNPTPNLAVEYLVIAGGGGGGARAYAGGGGAGGYRSNVSGESSGQNSSAEAAMTLSATDYTVTIGAGGAGGVTQPNAGSQGSSSTFNGITSTGGGGGGSSNTSATSGGSGGGASGYSPSAAGSGTTGQGYPGGNGGPQYGGDGGGGAGQVGRDGSAAPDGGPGGDGLYSSITGTSVARAGGGGGASSASGYSAGGGGAGGGGAGANYDTASSQQDGTANTGGGGGGASYPQTPYSGANGGSGVVIIRYDLSLL